MFFVFIFDSFHGRWYATQFSQSTQYGFLCAYGSAIAHQAHRAYGIGK